MNAPLIIFCFIVLLLLNALVDGFNYLGWTTHLKRYGILKHVLRLVEFAAWASFGGLFTIYYLHLNPDGWLYLLLAVFSYTLIRFGLFDIFLLWITKNDKHGNTSVFDWITAEVPILDNPIVKLVSAFIGICLLVIFF